MNRTLQFIFWAVVGGALLSQCTLEKAQAKQAEPYASEIKALQQQAKAETKAANKAVAAERKAQAKACDKSYAARGAQLDVSGRVNCQ